MALNNQYFSTLATTICNVVSKKKCFEKGEKCFILVLSKIVAKTRKTEHVLWVLRIVALHLIVRLNLLVDFVLLILNPDAYWVTESFFSGRH